MNTSYNKDPADKYDGHKGLKKIQRDKERRMATQKIIKYTNLLEGELDAEFESREKFRR